MHLKNLNKIEMVYELPIVVRGSLKYLGYCVINRCFD